MEGVDRHKLTPYLFILGRRDVNRFLRAEFSLIAQIVSKFVLTGPNRSNTETRGD